MATLCKLTLLMLFIFFLLGNAKVDRQADEKSIEDGYAYIEQTVKY